MRVDVVDVDLHLEAGRPHVARDTPRVAGRGDAEQRVAGFEPRQAAVRPRQSRLGSLAKTEHAREPLDRAREIGVRDRRYDVGRFPEISICHADSLTRASRTLTFVAPKRS